jgi:hypothetical protein
MARIRTVKPDLFRHEGLFDAERASGLPLRIAFAGLWTAADREGRFAWSPRTLKLRWAQPRPFAKMNWRSPATAGGQHDAP